MTDLISQIWAGLKDAGMPDVMLYLRRWLGLPLSLG